MSFDRRASSGAVPRPRTVHGQLVTTPPRVGRARIASPTIHGSVSFYLLRAIYSLILTFESLFTPDPYILLSYDKPADTCVSGLLVLPVETYEDCFAR